MHAKSQNEPMIWGDGTPYMDTETYGEATLEDGHKEEKGFRLKGDKLDDDGIEKAHHPLCQANPHGVPITDPPS